DKNNAGPTLSGLRRDVTGEGSHRHLSSSIRFKLQHKLISELTAHSCEVIIIERLPNGVFADPFELHHLVERAVFTDAAVFGDTNLELPSFRSNQSVVEIHMSLASTVLSRNEGDVEVNLDLPLHARYPPLGHGFSRVEFGQPDLFICCDLDGNVPNRSCLFMPIDHIVPDNKASAVIWDIPCGNKEHAGVVSAVTFGFAIVTAVLIVVTSVCYSRSEGSHNLKLS
ncbi:phosphatidylinositol-glycan biosynthesis class x protein, partial [Phtheirospermum japonicum]